MKGLGIILCLSFMICCTLFAEYVPPAPDYSQLDKVPTANLHLDEQFISACKLAAGYYKQSNKTSLHSNVLLITEVNNGYKEFLHNFLCYTDYLGIKFLAIALDRDVYGYIHTTQLATVYLFDQNNTNNPYDSKPSEFGGEQFNAIACRKIDAIIGALKLGYDVIFSDVDVAILKDPIDYLFFPNIDYIHSTNTGCNKRWEFHSDLEGNTGFHAIRSNVNTIRTFDLTNKVCYQNNGKFNDQTMLWLVLRTNPRPHAVPLPSCPLPFVAEHPISNDKKNGLITCPLDSCKFSAGNLRNTEQFNNLVDALQAKTKHYIRQQQQQKSRHPVINSSLFSSPIMAHANWILGPVGKKAAMKRTKLWLTSYVENESQPVNYNSTWECNNPPKELLKIKK